jgi:hypothetical protein
MIIWPKLWEWDCWYFRIVWFTLSDWMMFETEELNSLYWIKYWYCHVFEWPLTVDLLMTYTHHMELQVITALLLISTLYSSLEHPLSLFPACCLFISCSLVMASNSRDSSESLIQVLSLNPFVQNSTLNQLTTELTPRLVAISHQPLDRLFTGWLLSDYEQGCPSGLQDNSLALTT